jgi:hypothetical protein
MLSVWIYLHVQELVQYVTACSRLPGLISGSTKHEIDRKQFTTLLNNNSTIVSCSRSKMLLLLITTLSHNALGRPQADEDVKIITNPSPGQEYVTIHNGKTVIPLRQTKELDGDDDEGEYVGVCA